MARLTNDVESNANVKAQADVRLPQAPCACPPCPETKAASHAIVSVSVATHKLPTQDVALDLRTTTAKEPQIDDVLDGDVPESCINDMTPRDPYPDDDNAGVEPDPREFPHDLAIWVVNRNISLSATDELLALLSYYKMPHLPKTGRTLLGTPRSVELKAVCGGHYFHFGIAQSCRYALGLEGFAMPCDDALLHLYVHIDGVNVTKSTHSEFYPILGKVAITTAATECCSGVFLIGLFYGKTGKPGCATAFLEDFVKDCNETQANGIQLNDDGPMFKFKLKAVICDAPARAFVKCMKAHGGYWACDFCETEGEHYKSHGVVYPHRSATLRTDATFRNPDPANPAQTEHISPKERSPLLKIDGFDIVSGVTPEYMHCVTMGVMKKNAGMWFNVRSMFKVKGKHVDDVSRRLVVCSRYCPTEVGRKPRSLEFKEKFKATEWRSMLLYTGCAIVKGILTDERYKHFLLLLCAMKVLLCTELCAKYNDVANTMLRKYVQDYCKLYGRDNIVYNVHSLIHLAAAAQYHGNLEKISAFPFESYMQQLQAMLRKPNATLKQVVKRETERRRLKLPRSKKKGCRFMKPRSGGRIPTSFNEDVQQYKAVVMDGVRYAVSGGDSYVFLANQGVARIHNVLRRCDDSALVVVQFFLDVRDHFVAPIRSSQLGIRRVSKPSGKLKVRSLGDCNKVWYMPCLNDYAVCVELAHDIQL